MIPIKQGEGSVSGKVIKFRGPAITWVGVMPWLHGFVYGDEEGWLRFTSVDGPSTTNTPFKIIESDRSVNQVAFNECHGFRYIGACTASNVVIHRLIDASASVYSQEYEWGGHGIYSTGCGAFLVPRGQFGLAVITPSADGQPFREYLLKTRKFAYFYSMCRIGITADDKELWACAGRSGGLLAIALDKGARPEMLHSFQSKKRTNDYVGVCSIATETMPLAMVSLSRNGDVDFSTDLLRDRTPLTWHFRHTQGVAAVDGHLFILTSKGLYSCIDIVGRFLRGELRAGMETVTVRYLPSDIIDIAVAYDKWMLVLEHDKVLRIAINDLLVPGHSVATGHSDEHTTALESSDSEPTWADTILRSKVEELELAVA
jgi:hypothetical protein